MFLFPYVICLKNKNKIKKNLKKKVPGEVWQPFRRKERLACPFVMGAGVVPEAGVTVEDLLVAVGQKVGFDNIISGSRMNKAVVVFLKS